MKIGVVASSISSSAGGVAEAVKGQCIALAKVGIDVTVFAPDNGQVAVGGADWSGVKIELVPAAWPKFAWAPSLKQRLIEADLELVHLHGLWNAVSYSVLEWRKATGRPTVISPHGMLDKWALSRARAKKLLVATLFENANLRSASCLHALNAQEASSIRAYGLDVPIVTVPNGVDLPSLGHERSSTPDTKKMLFLGRIHPKKGVLETLEAWRIFNRDFAAAADDWKLVVAGWGDADYAAQLTDFVTRHGMEDHVEFAGPVYGSEKEALLKGADAFILASFSEGLPMAVLEGWAYALPVFMTRECNLLEGFETKAAIEVTTNPDDLALVFGQVLNQPKFLEEIGRAGRSLAEKCFSWSSVGQSLAQTYASLLDEK